MKRKLNFVGILAFAISALISAPFVRAADLERGEVAPTRMLVGCNNNLTAEKALLAMPDMSIAANVVFANSEAMRICQTEAIWGFAHNGKEFFAAVSTPAGGKLDANNNERDGNLWEDDSYEVFITDEAGKNGFHFIFNSKSGIYDAAIRDGQEVSSWNCAGVRVTQRQAGEAWQAVLSVPFASLGDFGAMKKWKAAIFRASNGKRAFEGITQFNGIFFQPDDFARLTLTDTPVAMRAMIDQRKLADGVLVTNFVGNLPKDMKLAWFVGVTPLDYATNDAYNQAKEQIVAEGNVDRAGDFRTAFTNYKLPKAGTIHLRAKNGEEVVFERFLAYDLGDFNKMEIAALYANGDRTQLCADLTLPTRPKVVGYSYGLRDAGGKVIVSGKTALAGSGKVRLPLKNVKPGKYTFFFKSEAGVEVSGDYAVLPEKPEWLGNTLGCTDGKAPAPWSDIVIDGDNAKVWNRTITFRGIPVSMTTAQGKIVENIRFEANGKPMKFVSSKWVHKAGDIAKCESVFTFPDGEMKVTSTLEFDGLVWLDCTFIPKKGKKLPTIVFRMEMPDGLGRFVYTAEHNARGSVMLDKKDSWFKDMMKHKPTFWVGSMERGIFFVADDLRGWKLRHYTRSAQVSEEKDGRRFITVPIIEQILARPGESRSVSFSLQGTPVRPMPEGWRHYRINAKRNNVRLYQHNITKLFNVPMPVRHHAKADLKMWRDKGVNALPYLASIAGSPFTDEFKWYSEQWRVMPHKRASFRPVNENGYVLVCPQGEGYIDWYIWNIDKMIDAIDANGLYFDYGQPGVYLCSNTLHGCGWKDNHGVARPSLRIRASREMQKRIYTLLKSKRPQGLVALHNSGGLIPAFHCLADITWNGEQTAVQVFHNDVSYSGLYELMPFMLEQNCQPWGVPVVFLPQFLRVIQLFDVNRFGDYNKIGWPGFVKAFNADPDSKRNIWFLSGLVTVVNGTYSGDWGMGAPLEGLHVMQEEIGWSDDVKFFGWYDSANPFKMLEPANAERVKASSHQGSVGWMITVVNDSDKDQKVRIAVPAEFAGKKFHMQPEDKAVTPVNGVLEWIQQKGSASFVVVK